MTVDRFATRPDLREAQERQARNGDRYSRASDREAWSKRANEIRARIPVSRVVGRVVTLKKAGRELTGLCPFHDERTPSFTVNDAKGFYHCFGCGQHGDALAFVMSRNALDFRAAVELLESENGLRHLQASRPAPPAPRAPQAEDVTRAETVARIWAQTAAIEKEGAVDLYLRGRSIIPPAEYGIGDAALNAGWPVDLRFHGACWHGLEKGEFPAMVAAYRIGTGALVAVHRTYLKRVTGGWTKAGTQSDKLHYGSRAGAVIRLAEPTDKMAAGEGIESSLSVMQRIRRAGYAYGSSDAMAAVEPPFICSDLVIGADWNAKGRTGEKAAWQAKKAFSSGRRIFVAVPDLRDRPSADHNDVLVENLTRERRSGEAA